MMQQYTLYNRRHIGVLTVVNSAINILSFLILFIYEITCMFSRFSAIGARNNVLIICM